MGFCFRFYYYRIYTGKNNPITGKREIEIFPFFPFLFCRKERKKLSIVMIIEVDENRKNVNLALAGNKNVNMEEIEYYLELMLETVKNNIKKEKKSKRKIHLKRIK